MRRGTTGQSAKSTAKEPDWKWTEPRGPIPPSLARWPGYVLGWISATGLAFYERSLAPLGIKAPHVSVLVILEAEGEMVQARLSDRLRIDKATMVAVLNDLEGKKWIARSPHPNDGRAYLVRITAAGTKALAGIKDISDEGTQAFFAALSPAEQKTFHELLIKLATPPTPDQSKAVRSAASSK